MFKLVTIGGKLRGTEYKLEEGENTLGRDSACNISIKIEGVSKKHLSVTVNKDTAFLEDLGSSNGTFVNGKLVKKITLNNGDKIALPNIILQLVHVLEKKVVVKKTVVKADPNVKEEDDNDIPPMPVALPAKVLYLFKYKIMPIIFEFNKEYEWRSIVAIILTVYIAITISLTIFPVLMDNRTILLNEIGTRGYHYAADIARMNALNLSRRNLDALDTYFLDKETGVVSYELFDMEGRIVRPLGKLNQYTSDTFSISAREAALAPKKPADTIARFLGDGELGIAQVIKAHNTKTGIEEAVGIIAIKFAPASLAAEAAHNSTAYLEAFTTSALVGIILFAIIYYLTIKHVEDVRFQVERVLRGRQKEVVTKLKWIEYLPLINTVNSLLLKLAELQSDSKNTDMADLESDAKYVEILKGFMGAANGPVMILNSEKLIVTLNPEAEDLTGIREAAGSGMSMLDVSRDQGFAATVIELCDQSANTGGMFQKGHYELTGKQYNVCVNALMGKDNFAKAFYLTFTKDD